MPVSLLLLIGLPLMMGAAMAGVLMYQSRRNRFAGPKPRECLDAQGHAAVPSTACLPRPSCWLAVKTSNVLAVQNALGLHHPKPCSWSEGLAADEKLFIAPPVKGWTLVMGSCLPEPAQDVDACFLFVLRLSHKLGQVQLFSASSILHHHAWVRAEHGRIVRAYAWAARTIWNQGARTAAENELGLKCFDYADPIQTSSFEHTDEIAANVDKVPQLAARWSLDPASIDQRLFYHEQGITGETSL
jgi:hypothetical protein